MRKSYATEKAIISWRKEAELPSEIEVLQGLTLVPIYLVLGWAAILGIGFLYILFDHGNGFLEFLFTALVSVPVCWIVLWSTYRLSNGFSHVERTYKACSELYQRLSARTDLSDSDKWFLEQLTVDFKRPYP
jgi:hypothetical protein